MVLRARIKVEREFMEGFRREFEAAMKQSLRDWAEEVLAESQKRVPVGATVGLKDSGHTHPPDPMDWMEVRYSAPYAMYVHEGTRPHWPPKGALLRWVELVLGLTGKEAERAEYLIRRAISVYGTKPNKFLLESLEEVMPRVEGIFERNIQAAMDRLTRRREGTPRDEPGAGSPGP